MPWTGSISLVQQAVALRHGGATIGNGGHCWRRGPSPSHVTVFAPEGVGLLIAHLGGPCMKDPAALLASLKDISSRLNQLASDEGKHELDPPIFGG